jgi:hypothetical protein
MRGYPDFFGQPMFEKFGPLERITVNYVFDTLGQVEIPIDIVNKGVLLEYYLYITSFNEHVLFDLQLTIDTNDLVYEVIEIPSEHNNIPSKIKLFDNTFYDRENFITRYELTKQLSFTDNLKVTLESGIAGTFGVYSLIFYRLIV